MLGKLGVVGVVGVPKPTTLKGTIFDVPPPGAGLVTSIINSPAVARLTAGIAEVNWVDET